MLRDEHLLYPRAAVNDDMTGENKITDCENDARFKIRDSQSTRTVTAVTAARVEPLVCYVRTYGTDTQPKPKPKTSNFKIFVTH